MNFLWSDSSIANGLHPHHLSKGFKRDWSGTDVGVAIHYLLDSRGSFWGEHVLVRHLADSQRAVDFQKFFTLERREGAFHDVEIGKAKLIRNSLTGSHALKIDRLEGEVSDECEIESRLLDCSWFSKSETSRALCETRHPRPLPLQVPPGSYVPPWLAYGSKL